jgi:nitrite reductase/ring-hydroxylating ferredoxin subunit
MAEIYHRVVKADDVGERALLPFIVNGWPVVICRDEGKVHALINRCSHAAAAFTPDGRVRRGMLMCPLHGARFRVDSGECVGGTPYQPLIVYPLRESADGWIEVAVPDAPPGPEHLPVTPLG